MVVRAGLFTLLALVLTSCMGAPLYSSTNVAAPTISGNGSVQRTIGAGGLYQSTTITSPSGQTMVRDCLAIQREWLNYLRSSGLQPNQGAWSNWLQIMILQRAMTIPDRCMDYATYGTPMSSGGGFGFGGGRTF
jgi:hypothetical protein